MKYVLGVFLVLDGLVHLLYAGVSQENFELKAGMACPDQSWLLHSILASDAVWLVAGIAEGVRHRCRCGLVGRLPVLLGWAAMPEGHGRTSVRAVASEAAPRASGLAFAGARVAARAQSVRNWRGE